MIAQRFRALGWVAGIASAATCLYLTSLQVAAERAELEGVEAKIASARRDMRQLQTEIGTRASLRQLEKWNGEVLALHAPRADQYLHAESELASVGMRELKVPGISSAVAPPVLMAAAQATPVQAPPPVVAPVTMASAPATTAAVQRVAFQAPERPKPVQPAAAAKPREALVVRAKPKREDKPAVREAVAKPKRPATAPVRVASTTRPLPIRPVLNRRALGDIERAAAAESRTSRGGPRR